MRSIVNETLKKVKLDFESNIKNKCLCDLKTIRFDNRNSPDYSNEEIQQLYLLRYFPAYLCEYKYIYNKILKTKKIKDISILSLGCGCCVDYLGAYLANEEDFENIKYFGIDAVVWNYIDSLDNPNFDISIADLKNIGFPSENDYNIIMFPKSISEISEESLEEFITELSKSKFKEDAVFLVSSCMDKGFKYDEERYLRMVRFLEQIGYKCNDYKGTCVLKEQGALFYLDNQFNYPNEIKNYIGTLSHCCKKYISFNKNCEPDCGVQLDKSPVLTGRYVSFQINLFER